MGNLKKEVKRFLVAGFSAVSTDLIIYYIMIYYLNHDIAKTFSFLLGTIVAFVINKHWTFQKHEKSYKEIFKFGVLYATTLGANVLTNRFVLDTSEMVFLAFFIATVVSTVLNFTGQKWWVFK